MSGFVPNNNVPVIDSVLSAIPVIESNHGLAAGYPLVQRFRKTNSTSQSAPMKCQ